MSLWWENTHLHHFFPHYIVYARFKVFSSPRRYLPTLSKIEAGDLQPCASPTVAAATLPPQDGPPVAARVLSSRSSCLGCSFAAVVGGRFIRLSLIILLIWSCGMWWSQLCDCRQHWCRGGGGSGGIHQWRKERKGIITRQRTAVAAM